MAGKFGLGLIALCGAVVAAGAAQAQGDPERGAKVFNRCKACHTLEEGKHRVGPSLHGIIGRKAGAAPGFKYSEAMAKAGIVWDDANLDKYLADPKGFIPGNKMIFPGLKKEEERADVIAYLKAEAGQAAAVEGETTQAAAPAEEAPAASGTGEQAAQAPSSAETPTAAPAPGEQVAQAASSAASVLEQLAAAGTMPSYTADLMSAEGQPIGTLTLVETGQGTLIGVRAQGLTPGEHGIHVHQTGRCEPPFESAGGHFSPEKASHGFASQAANHAGDLPNLHVGADGQAVAEFFNPRISLADGQGSLFDDDGSALVIHAGADDYRSDPAGNSGDRIACAVIQRAG